MSPLAFLFRHRRALSWGSLGAAILAVLMLGTIGIEKNLAVTEPDKTYSRSTIIFFVLQMLGLDAGGFPEPVGWELETARCLAVLVFFGAVLKALATFFQRPIEAAWLKHVVSRQNLVCGAGERGARISRQLLDAGEEVVVIDRNGSLSVVEELRIRGAYVVIGDATHADVLARAGARRARRIVATCHDDATNLRVGAAALAMSAAAATAAPTAHIHCGDPAAFELLATQATASPVEGKPRPEFIRFDVPSNIARVLLAAYPLDREPISADSARFVQLIVIGRSPEAESIVLACARQSHHANLIPARIVVIAADALAWEASLRFRFPQIDKPCRIEFIERPPCHPATLCDVDRLIADDDAITTIVLSPVSPSEALTVASRLPQVAARKRVRVFAHLGTAEGIHGPANEAGNRVEFVSIDNIEGAFRLDAVLQDRLDRQARVMHEAYVRERVAEGKQPDAMPAIRPWETLAETYRQANRSNADHIAVKLRAVGRRIVPAGEEHGCTVASFTAEEVEVMARMEHARWNADRWLDGWKYGRPRDNAAKIHNNLVPWDELDEDTKKYDRKAVIEIPAMLAAVGLSIASVTSDDRS